METKFQTSFIPKRPMITSDSTIRTHHSVSLFMMVGVLFFIVSIAGAAFVVVYKQSLLNTQKSYQDTLAKNENEFNPTLIDTLRRVNTKIDVSKNLIANHAAVSEIFGIIGALTAENIQFKSLDYTAPTGGASAGSSGNLARLSMQGIGTGFKAIAFQSDVFGMSSQYGRNIVLKNPVLSNLSLDQNSNVSFTFTAGIDPSNFSYTKVLNQSLGTTDTTDTTITTPTDASTSNSN